MAVLLHGGYLVNEGKVFQGSLIFDNGNIVEIREGSGMPRGVYDKTVDATGCYVFPGVIDEHVHFREPGMTAKADMDSETQAAAAGGVTSFFDMPNTNPQTTTLDALSDKKSLARTKSHINYSFFLGATNDNAVLFSQLDRHHVPGIKLFMGASTGNMLVDKRASLETIFKTCTELDLPLMTHCEDTELINEHIRQAKLRYGDDPDVSLHPVIRDEEACYRSSSEAVELASEYGTRLHVAHVSTARELELFGISPLITAEVVISHLMFNDADYADKGALIKCNPAVKTAADQQALRQALSTSKILCVATDHAPHQLSDKQGGCCKASSGMPMIQFSLVSMLELSDLGYLSLPRVAELMCHNPASLFQVHQRGYLRKGFRADITVVRPHCPWTVTPQIIKSKCGWSPLLGHQFDWKVEQTYCNGHLIYNNGRVDTSYIGEEIVFR